MNEHNYFLYENFKNYMIENWLFDYETKKFSRNTIIIYICKYFDSKIGNDSLVSICNHFIDDDLDPVDIQKEMARKILNEWVKEKQIKKIPNLYGFSVYGYML